MRSLTSLRMRLWCVNHEGTWRRPRRLLREGSLLALLALVAWSPTAAGEPLHQRIDALIAESQVAPAAAVGADGAFIRRLYLDLTGTIPTADEARAFIDDADPQKRAKLVRRVLEHPLYARHMAQVFDVMLLERRPDKHVKQAEWIAYLEKSFAENKPYDQLSREILGATGMEPETRPAAKFYLDRLGEPNVLTRDVGRVFFGMDLQCAQCHDHPLIADYFQSDYYGIFAFLNRGYLFTDPQKKTTVFGEKAVGLVSFKSVFTAEEGLTGPRLPGQVAAIPQPAPEGALYKVLPSNTSAGVPRVSLRDQLAELATTGQNEAFNRNIANRLWAQLMGRGLVEPVDLHHSDNPPAHPELLELLAAEFAAMNFDIREFLGQLALTHAYQRDLRISQAVADQQTQQQLASRLPELKQAQQVAQEGLEAARKNVASLQEQIGKLNGAHAAALKAQAEKTDALRTAQVAVQTAAAAVSATEGSVAAKQMLLTPLQEAVNAGEQAAKLVADAKALGEALAPVKTRLGKEQAALKKLQDELAKQTKAHSDAQAKAEAARTSWSEAVDQCRPVIAQREPLLKQLGELQAKERVAFRTSVAADQRVVAAETVQQLAGLRQEAAQLKPRGDLLTQQLPQLAKQIAAQAGRIEQLTAEHTKLAAQSKELATAMAQLQQESQQRAAAGTLLTEAAGQLTKASAVAADDPQLAALAKELQTPAATQSKLAKELLATLADRKREHEGLELKRQQLAQQLAKLKASDARDREEQRRLTAEQESVTKRLAEITPELNRLQGELDHHWSRQFLAASLKPMTPEQLCWSILQATGVAERQVAASRAEIDKKQPLSDADKQDPAKLAAREREVVTAAYDKLQGNVAQFVKLFGAGAGQPQVFFATVDQALFLSNGSPISSWLTPGSGSLTKQLADLSDLRELADTAYLATLTRRPTDDERTDIEAYLKDTEGEARTAAIQEIVWALLTCNEFRFGN